MGSGLWSGADVRWVGPERDRDGVCVERGDRAVVVDAGRHHVSSFGPLTARSGKHLRSGRGVVIRLPDGEELRVPAKYLELVPREHPLRPEPDGRRADWWLDVLDDWDRPLPISSFVPRSFPAVCRILHPWIDRNDGRVTWQEAVSRSDASDRRALAQRLAASQFGSADPIRIAQVNEPREGELDHHTAATLVDLLTQATATPNDVLFAVWVGWGDIPAQRFPGAARVDTPNQGHFLLRGPLHGALTSISASPVGARPVSGIWWPADREWFLHTEIDFPGPSWPAAPTSSTKHNVARTSKRSGPLSTPLPTRSKTDPLRDDR